MFVSVLLPCSKQLLVRVVGKTYNSSCGHKTKIVAQQRLLRCDKEALTAIAVELPYHNGDLRLCERSPGTQHSWLRMQHSSFRCVASNTESCCCSSDATQHRS